MRKITFIKVDNLGLGDSNYSTYQGAPKKLEKFLVTLGAQKVVETGAADDQVGYVYCEEFIVINFYLL